MTKTAPLWMFGFLHSAMHTTWCRVVCGRIKSDLRISTDIAYNAFPFPEMDDKMRDRLAVAATAVIAARESHLGATLADLYDPHATPLDRRAHEALDKVVDGKYGKIPSEVERSARLFERCASLSGEGMLPAS